MKYAKFLLQNFSNSIVIDPGQSGKIRLVNQHKERDWNCKWWDTIFQNRAVEYQRIKSSPVENWIAILECFCKSNPLNYHITKVKCDVNIIISYYHTMMLESMRKNEINTQYILCSDTEHIADCNYNLTSINYS